ncbi:MAG: hypothetical protein AB6733_14625 [Clostridiaceae bacterium]
MIRNHIIQHRKFLRESMLIISRSSRLDRKLSEFEIYRAKKIMMQNRVDDIYIITDFEVKEEYLRIDFGLTRYEDKHKEKIEKNQILAYYLKKFLDYKMGKLKYISGISKEDNKKDEVYERINFDALDLDVFFE